VESSHAYLNFDKFLSEVKRVLKPGGYFLFTDLRLKNQIQPMFLSFEKSGLKIIENKDITANIIQSLDLDFERRMGLVKRLLPKFSHQWARNFSGIKGSGLYKSFKTGDRKYFSLVLRN
jgi:SAM-dependent methyltransferase